MGLIQPFFKITADGSDITALINDRLISLKVRDEKGWESDTCEIDLDDRDNLIELPRKGAVLGIWMGQPGKLAKMGDFTIDEPGISGPPDTLHIRGKAADMMQGLKAPKTRGFDDVSIADLVTTIATAHGLKAMTAASLASTIIHRIDQTNESDMHLLTRLASERDVVASIKNGRLLFMPRGEARSASGQPLTRVTLARHQITTWDASFPDRGKYPRVEAVWHDQDAATEQKVFAGSGSPVYPLRKKYPDAASAQAAADAKLKSLDRGAGTANLTVLGNNHLLAEAEVEIVGMRTGLDGVWLCNSAEHTADDGGYNTDIELEMKT